MFKFYFKIFSNKQNLGTKRFDSEKAGDREVQRTMLELLNQLDGFQPNDDIKVIAATNRVDVLDPALLRSGRLDRKIELPHPDEEARRRIMQIHSRKMNVDKNVNFDELARSTEDFNGAQCKAVCIESVIKNYTIAFQIYFSYIGYDCSSTQRYGSNSRRLYGRDSGSSSEEKVQFKLLRLIPIYV